ncbi:MAG: GHKL domain-containing protein [Chitinophagaceae bacterium]|nr:MAG: GHKL domain-containing protein [Chitinophagaceae bacterium]
MKAEGISRKLLVFSGHLALWAILFLTPIFFFRAMGNARTFEFSNIEIHWYLNIVSWIALFYFNAYFIFPRFIFRKKYLAYFLWVMVMLLLLLLLNYLSFTLLVAGKDWELAGAIFFYIFPCIFILAGSIGFRELQQRMKQDREDSERENIHLKTELTFLRSQISPHFMFNILNNMVALARFKSDQLEPSLMKLSGILRYMLYEANTEKVTLEMELVYIRHYIDLQMQRFAGQVELTEDISPAHGNLKIAPMLLIPLVENAFKHGTGIVTDPFIEIRSYVEDELLRFTIRNRFAEKTAEALANHGIGMANVQRRLSLLYKDKHELKVTSDNDIFTVSLQINLAP